jgi:hypothetical protein
MRILMAVVIIFLGVSEPDYPRSFQVEEETATPSPTPTITPYWAVTPQVTDTPTPLPTETVTPTDEPTVTATAVFATAEPSDTPPATATAVTVTVSPTATLTPTVAATATPDPLLLEIYTLLTNETNNSEPIYIMSGELPDPAHYVYELPGGGVAVYRLEATAGDVATIALLMALLAATGFSIMQRMARAGSVR